jgi:transposase
VHGVDESEQPVLRRQVRRREMAKVFAKLAPTRIGLEACGASHYWARALRGLGHEVVLMPPQYIKPYVKRGKNDAIDAAAICAAMSRPGMRFVAVKSAEQQAALMLLKVRDLLVKQRTMLINAMRGHAAEFGLVAAKGPVKVAELLQRAQANESGVPTLAREMLSLLSGQLVAFDAKLKALDTQLMALHKGRPGEPVPGNPARHRADRRAQLFAQGHRSPGLPLGPPLCRLARHHPEGERHRRAAPAGSHQPTGR